MSGGHPASFTARDASSSIERAQYSLDGGDWILVVPNTGISDALVEHYDFGLPALTPGEHTIAGDDEYAYASSIQPVITQKGWSTH